MPVFRSTWCGRFSSPVSLSSTKEFGPSAWCDRRMLRRDGEVFRLGTAIGNLGRRGNEDGGQTGRRRERGGVPQRRVRIKVAKRDGCGPSPPRRSWRTRDAARTGGSSVPGGTERRRTTD